MEFDFSLNSIIHDEITVIESNLIFRKFDGSIEEISACREIVKTLIDKLGFASAKAQGLNVPVTDTRKFSHSEQLIYLLTDFSEKNGMVIGFLKVGRKRLFLFDLKGVIWDRYFLCILDFYIHESKQREGYGKRLFDFMLQDNNVLPEQLPIDRPSKKSLQFLYKHYGLKTIIPQPNNFVIFDQFFKYV